MRSLASKIQGRRNGRHLLGSDPLTTSLVWLAFVLAAAMAALCFDLWWWPDKANLVIQASAPKQPANSATDSSIEFALALSPAPDLSSVLGESPTPSPSPKQDLSPTPGPSPTPRLSPPPGPSPAPGPSPTSAPDAAAVRIRIPAIGVDRSIIEVPLTYDSRSGTWSRDYTQLFRQGRQDLVGHIAESALPGQPGNIILAGHNYGYGTNGVFLRLNRLRAGDRVEIVSGNGRTSSYRVTEVTSIPWTKKDQQELLRHSAYLSVDGPERLTLVTCGGSSWAPFPERVYVVAAPVR